MNARTTCEGDNTPREPDEGQSRPARHSRFPAAPGSIGRATGDVTTPEGAAVPANTLAELRRDMCRLRFVKQQIKEIEAARAERVQREPTEQRHAMLQLLARSGSASRPLICSCRRCSRASYAIAGRSRVTPV